MAGAGGGDGIEADLVRVYLDPARVDGFGDRAFSIGPFGQRVSFASQQRRALNTIWALEQKGLLKPTAKVAVIGGGLAGVMVASALVVRKCIVYLYERNGRVLSLQQQTTHRYLHPTINLWPEITFFEGPPLSGAGDGELPPTTVFPFFDWHADQCARVIDRLHEEWNVFFRRRLTQVYVSTTVTGVAATDEGLVVSATGEAPSESDPFDLVIFASGFGDERKVQGIDSTGYWDIDWLANDEGAGPSPLVSGIGDGGLIETLRAVHTHFAKGHFCVEIAQLMNTTPVPALIRELEEKVIAQAAGDREEASKLYAVAYAEVLKQTPILINDKLDASLRRNLNEPVLLLGRQACPYSLTAAPIHKFMLTHAIERGTVVYARGELRDGPELILNGRVEPVPDRPLIVRHGPDITFGDILDHRQLTSLRLRQTVMADLLRAVPYDGSHWHGLPEYPEQDPSDPNFAAFRFPDAMQYVLREFKLPLWIAMAGNVPQYFVAPDLTRPELPSVVPKHLFGVPASVGEGRTINVGN